MNENFYNGFIKRAQDYGLSVVEADDLYKTALDPKHRDEELSKVAKDSSAYIRKFHTGGLSKEQFDQLSDYAASLMKLDQKFLNEAPHKDDHKMRLEGMSGVDDLLDVAKTNIPKNKKNEFFRSKVVEEISDLGKPPWYLRLIGEKPIMSSHTVLTNSGLDDVKNLKQEEEGLNYGEKLNLDVIYPFANQYVISNSKKTPDWFVKQLIKNKLSDKGNIFINSEKPIHTF